ncbi:EAL domain-containing protein [Halopseudomonas aestusnigri]|uniref:PAS domain S-box-containing protein/diguanylate cyclase (GGDEF) domain-containing protein n=1 Tax=Halopseudomonas aestusnigri TaxID=857252 RepID=A0AAQ1G5Z7_9GAMM|nr:EAL domain-containing protein [Halopseudomonas aestusnigri]OWL89170.1 histidine kinase [Halopseudomonas aestusnigri]SEG03631.1 PAS domain S-box-containing protein/diguanylate cyclase (GGDEF) domain-containing protein [Halopseudomonas aestusnigri]
MFLDLVENLTLLIALCWLHAMIMRYLDGYELPGKVCSGVLFGAVCIVGMMIPLELADGLIFDGRTVVLSMAAFFGGPLVAGIAGVMAGLFRLSLGGVGLMPGLLNVAMPVLMGLLFRYLYRHHRIPFNVLSLLIFSAGMHLLEVLILALLPADNYALFLEHALVPLLAVLIPAAVLLGLLLEDVEQQRQARDALRQSEAYLKAVTDAVPDVFMVLDEQGTYLKVSTPQHELLAAEQSKLLNRRLQDVLPKEQADRFLEFIARTLDTDQPQSIEYSMQTLAGIRTFEARARRLEVMVGGRRAVVLLARDISDRVALELDQRIAAIAFESQQGMLVTDAHTRIIKANRAFSAITGYSEAEVLGQPTRILGSGHQGAEFYRQMWQALYETGGWQGEIWNRRKSGEAFPEWLTISAVHDAKGRLTNYVASLTDISERKDAEEKIQHLAFYDPLTNLPNRRLMRQRLEQALVVCRREQHYAALIFLDLDDFKNVNDLYGHQIGDGMLCQVAERLRHALRERDTVARFGGDEFVVLLEGLEVNATEAATQVEHIGRKLLQTLREPYLIKDQVFSSSASLGIVLFNDEQHTADELMQYADLSMYSAKAAGKDMLSFYDPQMQAVVSMRIELEEDIRRGLAQEEFVLYLQPQADASGNVEGAEALVRWQHPARGLLAPGVFIDIAERSGLIEPLDLAILRQGCELLARWAQQPHTAALTLAINISARFLYRDDFVCQVRDILQHTGASALQLKLEITESLLLTDVDKAVSRMQLLRDMGVRFAIDDFGTGYSSMAYLQRLPLDQLKIDQSFVRGLPDDKGNVAIVRAILSMAEGLELEVIAEGVEHPAQQDILRLHGCRHFQGYLFGKPMSVDAFIELL